MITRTQWLLLLVLIHAPVRALFKEESSHNYRAAVVKDPIVEMGSSFPAPDHPGASPDVKSCRRAHQGLYNEQVDCLEEHDDQIKISYPAIIYGFDAETQKALNTFWMYKKHIVPLRQLKGDLLESIPSPHYAHDPTVVITYPWKEFSVGTRFKHRTQDDTHTDFAVERIDYAANTTVFDLVPRDNAIREVKQEPQSARKLFVKITNDLIDRVAQSGNDHVIPYVWGGSSFVEPYSASNFYKKDGTWHRDGKSDPYSGYDCSEFVMRMAKISGLDFPWKTTTAIERSKRALNDKDQLEEGDLIWVKGHVMIVSNIEDNEIIESRAYGCGYGCVHRISLGECFEGITTYNDLLERYYTNQTITFKDKQGIPEEKSNVFKILKMIN